MKRLLFLLAAGLFLAAGCSRKPVEVSAAAKAEAASLVSEAQFAMQIREHARAAELFERALKLDEATPEYWVGLGMARRKQDDRDAARKAYRKALELHAARYKEGHDPRDLAQQAWVMALLGRSAEAVKLLEKGLKDHPDDPVMKKMADPRGLPRTFETPEFKAMAV